MSERLHGLGDRIAGTPLFEPLRAALDRRRGRTSLTDQSHYTGLCEMAVRSPAVFDVFKADPRYIDVLEHVTCQQGDDYLGIALSQTPEFAEYLDRFRENDRIGNPKTWDYGEHGRFSPTTLRYVKVLSDLISLFGDVDALNIIEIGAGYGGQCFITNTVCHPESYTLIDLVPCLRLQEKYLSEHRVERVVFLDPAELSSAKHCDLVISNYAFSECVRDVQNTYLQNVLLHAPRGYLTCNWVSSPHFRSLQPEELLREIPGSRFIAETPLTSPDNAILVWGTEAR